MKKQLLNEIQSDFEIHLRGWIGTQKVINRDFFRGISDSEINALAESISNKLSKGEIVALIKSELIADGYIGR